MHDYRGRELASLLTAEEHTNLIATDAGLCGAFVTMVVFQQQNLESWMGRLVLSRWFICKVNKGWFTYILCCNRLSNLRNAETDVSALLPTRDPPLVSETDFLHWRM